MAKLVNRSGATINPATEEDAATILAAINAISGGNLDTDLNTIIATLATLALESGGNLDTIVATLATLALESEGNLDSIVTAIQALNGTGITYASASFDIAAAGTGTPIAAPAAGLRHWIYGIIGTAGVADGTILLRDGAATALTGTMPIAQNGGFVLPISQNPAIP